MARSEPIKVGVDYTAVAQAMEDWREMLRAMVAGLEAEGFTPREARRLVTAALDPAHTSDEPEKD